MSKKTLPPLWRCPNCGARFVTKNIWHSCGKYSLKKLFSRCDPNVIRLFRKFATMVRSCGPAIMIPQKTRVVFMVRVRFAGAYPRKSHLLCGLGLSKRINNPRFVKIESYGTHFHGHLFKVAKDSDLNAEVRSWIRMAYEVGEQRIKSQRSKVRGQRLEVEG